MSFFTKKKQKTVNDISNLIKKLIEAKRAHVEF